MKRILPCLGSAADRTFAYCVARFAELGASCIIFDTAELARRGIIHSVLRTGSAELRVLLDGIQVDITSATPVFARLMDIAAGAPSDALAHRARALTQVIQRVLRHPARPRCVNPTPVDVTNASKLAHLMSLGHLVETCGAGMPRTLVTTSRADAIEFIDQCGGEVVVKGASAVKTIAATWRRADASRISEDPPVPVLLQERIVGPDVRVHVVGGESFGEMVVSRVVDYRFQGPKVAEPTPLPAQIHALCVEAAKQIGVSFAGIDFKLDVERERWIFLEINAAPAFEGYDRRASGAISAAIWRYLQHET